MHARAGIGAEGRAGRGDRGRGGFSLLELTVAVVLLVLAIGGLSGVLVAAVKLNQANRETTLALAAARQTLENLQAEEFADAFARFNTDPADDPGGPGTAPGAAFAVLGLTPQAGDPDGLVGELEFPVVPAAGTDVELREDVVDAALGMPHDLDGDGDIEAGDRSNDYTLLPVRVRIRWTGVTGDRDLAVETFLGDR